MSRLFVIGNGFDTAHGLQTKYSDFRSFVCKKNRKIFNIIEQAEIEYNKTKKQACDLSENWSYFEDILEYMDFSQYNKEEETEFREILTYGAAKPIEKVSRIGDKINSKNSFILNGINRLFNEWINEVNIQKFLQKDLQFNTDDKFLNFNYTNTLEMLYEIEGVNHIHRDDKANEGYRYIFGFKGEEEAHEEPTNLRAHFRPAYKNIAPDIAAVKNEFIKPVCSIIDEGKVDYGKNEIKEIYFWGFELADVDKPYIEKIINDHIETIEKVKLCKFQYCDEKKREKYRQFIKNCGLDIELECFEDYS